MDNRVSTYKRLLQSEIAESILANSKIFLDANTLRPLFIGKNQSKGGELYRYMKSASQNGGYISTEYHSKDIITARMFVCKNHLNVINLTDERILSAMKSRYDGGRIVCLDYKAFEPSIIRGVLGEVFPENFHSWVAELLGLERKDVKQMNMALLYCASYDDKIMEYAAELVAKSVPRDGILLYSNTLIKIREAIEEFVADQRNLFETKGYVVNPYGRKIYPKESRNIFSNIIQSIGSEILVDSIININDLFIGKEAHILFHRFDALYLDMSKREIPKTLPKVVNIMESSGSQIQLSVGIQLGESVASLKDIEIG